MAVQATTALLEDEDPLADLDPISDLVSTKNDPVKDLVTNANLTRPPSPQTPRVEAVQPVQKDPLSDLEPDPLADLEEEPSSVTDSLIEQDPLADLEEEPDPLADISSEGQKLDTNINPIDVYNYLKGKGLSDSHAKGIISNIRAESGFNSDIEEIGKDPKVAGLGLFQYTEQSRRKNFIKNVPNWKTNWQGQIDFALSEELSKKYIEQNFKSPEEASKWFTKNWERPKNMDLEAEARAKNVNNFEKGGKRNTIKPAPISEFDQEIARIRERKARESSFNLTSKEGIQTKEKEKLESFGITDPSFGTLGFKGKPSESPIGVRGTVQGAIDAGKAIGADLLEWGIKKASDMAIASDKSDADVWEEIGNTIKEKQKKGEKLSKSDKELLEASNVLTDWYSTESPARAEQFQENVHASLKNFKKQSPEIEKENARAADYVSGGGSLTKMKDNFLKDPIKWTGDLVQTFATQLPMIAVMVKTGTKGGVAMETSRFSSALTDMEEETSVKLDKDIKLFMESAYGGPMGYIGVLSNKLQFKQLDKVRGGIMKQIIVQVAKRFGGGVVEGIEEMTQDQVFKLSQLAALKLQRNRYLESGDNGKAKVLEAKIKTELENLWNPKELKQSGILGFLLGTGIGVGTSLVKGELTGEIIEGTQRTEVSQLEEKKQGLETILYKSRSKTAEDKTEFDLIKDKEIELEKINKDIAKRGLVGKEIEKISEEDKKLVKQATDLQKEIADAKKNIVTSIPEEELTKSQEKIKGKITETDQKIEKAKEKTAEDTKEKLTKLAEKTKAKLLKEGGKVRKPGEKERTGLGISIEEIKRGTEKIKEKDIEKEPDEEESFEPYDLVFEGKVPIIPTGWKAAEDVKRNEQGQKVVRIEPTEKTLQKRDPEKLFNKLKVKAEGLELEKSKLDPNLKGNQAEIKRIEADILDTRDRMAEVDPKRHDFSGLNLAEVNSQKFELELKENEKTITPEETKKLTALRNRETEIQGKLGKLPLSAEQEIRNVEIDEVNTQFEAVQKKLNENPDDVDAQIELSQLENKKQELGEKETTGVNPYIRDQYDTDETGALADKAASLYQTINDQVLKGEDATENQKEIRETVKKRDKLKFRNAKSKDGVLDVASLPSHFQDSFNEKGKPEKGKKIALKNPPVKIYKSKDSKGKEVTVVEIEGSTEETQRLMPEMTKLADIIGTIVIGNGKWLETSTISNNSPIYSSTGKYIVVEKAGLDKTYEKKGWTKPTVKGVKALPENAFTSLNQFYEFVLHHENAHLDFPMLSGKVTEGEAENIINHIALLRTGRAELAKEIYGELPAYQEIDEFAGQWRNLSEYNELRVGTLKKEVTVAKEKTAQTPKSVTPESKTGPPEEGTGEETTGEPDADKTDDIGVTDNIADEVTNIISGLDEKAKAELKEKLRIAALRNGRTEAEAEAESTGIMENITTENAVFLTTILKNLDVRISTAEERAAVAEYEAYHDKLTGALNRVGAEAKGYLKDKSTTIDRKQMFMDIDDFGKFNKKHDHETGDRVLTTLANSFMVHYDGLGDLIRWSGDEFIFIFNKGVTDAQIVKADKKFRDNMATNRFQGANKKTPDGVHFTAGIGNTKAEANAQEQLAKKAGKNRLYIGGKDARKITIKKADYTGTLRKKPVGSTDVSNKPGEKGKIIKKKVKNIQEGSEIRIPTIRNKSIQKFNKELGEKLENKLKKLFPHIILEYTNDPITHKDGEVYNQQEEIDDAINFKLKVVATLLDLSMPKQTKLQKKTGITPQLSRTTIRLNSKEKPNIEENFKKFLRGRGVPDQQTNAMFQTMRDHGIESIGINDLILLMAKDYGFTVEMPTAVNQKFFNLPETFNNVFYDDHTINQEEFDKAKEYWPELDRVENGYPVDINGTILMYSLVEYMEEENQYEPASDIFGNYVYNENNKLAVRGKKRRPYSTKKIPTAYYIRMTRPGGTNYREVRFTVPGSKPIHQGHAAFTKENDIGWTRVDEVLSSFQKVLRVLEIQSDLFQKNREETELSRFIPETGELEENEFETEIEEISFEIEMENREIEEDGDPDGRHQLNIDELKYDLEYLENRNKNNYDVIKEKVIPNKPNQFLQFLNMDGNWIKFFIDSIIQDAAKKGYTKVYFPTGETAAKVEGHQVIADRIKNIDSNIAEYEKILENKDFISSQAKETTEAILDDFKKEKQNLKTEGLEKIVPIEAFYENRVANILIKKFGAKNVKLITDEPGSTWREVTINTRRDLSPIMLQQEKGEILGQANIEAGKILINRLKQKQDTLPHEYAHHYISWFRDSKLVQEGIKRFGSEEKLVNAIGEQAVLQNGEAWNWWKRFTKWVLNHLNKEQVLQILTDSFLTNRDLADFEFDIAPKETKLKETKEPDLIGEFEPVKAVKKELPTGIEITEDPFEVAKDIASLDLKVEENEDVSTFVQEKTKKTKPSESTLAKERIKKIKKEELDKLIALLQAEESLRNEKDKERKEAARKIAELARNKLKERIDQKIPEGVSDPEALIIHKNNIIGQLYNILRGHRKIQKEALQSWQKTKIFNAIQKLESEIEELRYKAEGDYEAPIDIASTGEIRVKSLKDYTSEFDEEGNEPSDIEYTGVDYIPTTRLPSGIIEPPSPAVEAKLKELDRQITNTYPDEIKARAQRNVSWNVDLRDKAVKELFEIADDYFGAKLKLRQSQKEKLKTEIEEEIDTGKKIDIDDIADTDERIDDTSIEETEFNKPKVKPSSFKEAYEQQVLRLDDRLNEIQAEIDSGKLTGTKLEKAKDRLKVISRAIKEDIPKLYKEKENLIRQLNWKIKLKYADFEVEHNITETDLNKVIKALDENRELELAGFITEEINKKIIANNKIIRETGRDPNSNANVISKADEQDNTFTNDYPFITENDLPFGDIPPNQVSTRIQGPSHIPDHPPINEKPGKKGKNVAPKILIKGVDYTTSLAQNIYLDAKYIVDSLTKKNIMKLVGREWTKLIGQHKRLSEAANLAVVDITMRTTKAERGLLPMFIQGRDVYRKEGLGQFKSRLINDLKETYTVVSQQLEEETAKIERFKAKDGAFKEEDQTDKNGEIVVGRSYTNKERLAEIKKMESAFTQKTRTKEYLANAEKTMENLTQERVQSLLSLTGEIDSLNNELFKLNQAAFKDMSINQQVDYVAQIWGKQDFVNEKGEINVNTFRKFIQENRFLENKFYDSYLDGIKSSRNPRYYDIAEIIDMNAQTALQAISNKTVLDMLRGNNEANTQLIMDANKEAQNLGYVPIERLGIRVENLAGMIVHPDAIPAMKALFLDRRRGKYWSLLEYVNGLAKKLNLSGSFFHHLTLLETAIGTIGAKGIYRKVKDIDMAEVWKKSKSFGYGEDAPDMIKTIKDGSYHMILKNWEDAADFLEYGGQLGSVADVFQESVDKLLENIVKIETAIGKKTKLPQVFRGKIFETIRGANKLMDRFLWDYLHNSLKLDGYKILLEENIRISENKYGRLTDKHIDTIKIETAKQVNDTYGGQNWKAMMTNPRILQMSQVIFLSPDWTVSTVKQFFSIFGKFSQLKSEESKFIRKRMGISFWTKATLWYALPLQMMNAMLRLNDDEEEWEKRVRDLREELRNATGLSVFSADERLQAAIRNKPTFNLSDQKDWLHYSTLGNTAGNKYSIFSGRNAEGREVYRSFGKQFKEVFEYAMDLNSPEAVDFLPEFGPQNLAEPFIRLAGKVSPVLRASSIIVFGNSPSGMLTGWDPKTAKLRQQGKYTEATWETIKSVAAQALPFSADNIFGGDEVEPFDFVIGKKQITRSKMRQSIHKAYEDLFNDKVKNGGIASTSAQAQWEARIQRISKSAIDNGFDPLPLFKGVVDNTIKGVKEGSKGKVWNSMGELNDAEQAKKDRKDLIKKTSETIKAKMYVDNLTVLYQKIIDQEQKQFNKQAKRIDFTKEGE